jgi:DNA polymerase-3 subunit delta'
VSSTVTVPGLVPLVGHEALRERLALALRQERLPASLLLHGGAGIGKQRLALWLGALLLCDRAEPAPCGHCAHCRLTGLWRHPDLHWFFPRPRLKDGDPSTDDVLNDLADAIESRAAAGGVYPPADPTDGLYVSTMRALVRTASVSPAMAARRVFIVAQAERLVPQEGADQAANAFLKLLEEPPANAFLILTSNEPAALLPTIRSRLVSIRVPPIGPADWRTLLADDRVIAATERAGVSRDRLLRDEHRALGALLGAAGDEGTSRAAAARALFEAAGAPNRDDGRAARARAAFIQGAAGARGSFAGVLDQLLRLMTDESRAALARGDAERADRYAHGSVLVERARARTAGNANPMLLSSQLLRDLQEALT